MQVHKNDKCSPRVSSRGTNFFLFFLFIIILHIILQGYTNSKMLICVWTLNYFIVLARVLDAIGEFSSSLTSDEADEVACGYFCCIEGGHR